MILRVLRRPAFRYRTQYRPRTSEWETNMLGKIRYCRGVTTARRNMRPILGIYCLTLLLLLSLSLLRTATDTVCKVSLRRCIPSSVCLPFIISCVRSVIPERKISTTSRRLCKGLHARHGQPVGRFNLVHCLRKGRRKTCSYIMC